MQHCHIPSLPLFAFRLSFLSGHTSVSAYCAIFFVVCAFYFKEKFSPYMRISNYVYVRFVFLLCVVSWTGIHLNTV